MERKKNDMMYLKIKCLNYEILESGAIGKCFGWSEKEYFVTIRDNETKEQAIQRLIDLIVQYSTTYIHKWLYEIL